MTKLLLIVIVQLIYVPLLTLRTITMVKNLKVLTATFGFLEAFVYVFGLAIVLSGEQSTIAMAVYAIGFAIGLFLGIYVEQKMAIGYISVYVNINHPNNELVSQLRNLGFGVTVYHGQGKDSQRYRMEILSKRKRENELYRVISDYEPKAFIISYEPKSFKGGYLTELMKKRSGKRILKINKKAETDSVVSKSLREIKEETKELIKTWKY